MSKSDERRGPFIEAGRVWWGPISVSFRSYVEARAAMQAGLHHKKNEACRQRDEPQGVLRNADASSRAALHHVGSLVPADMPSAKGMEMRTKNKAVTLTDDPIMSAEDVAELLGKGVQYVRKLCRKGRRKQRGEVVSGPYLIASRVGLTWKIRRSEVFKMLGRLEAGEE